MVSRLTFVARGKPQDIEGSTFVKYIALVCQPKRQIEVPTRTIIQPTYANNQCHCLRSTKSGTAMTGVTFTIVPNAKQSAEESGFSSAQPTPRAHSKSKMTPTCPKKAVSL